MRPRWPRKPSLVRCHMEGVENKWIIFRCECHTLDQNFVFSISPSLNVSIRCGKCYLLDLCSLSLKWCSAILSRLVLHACRAMYVHAYIPLLSYFFKLSQSIEHLPLIECLSCCREPSDVSPGSAAAQPLLPLWPACALSPRRSLWTCPLCSSEPCDIS